VTDRPTDQATRSVAASMYVRLRCGLKSRKTAMRPKKSVKMGTNLCLLYTDKDQQTICCQNSVAA